MIGIVWPHPPPYHCRCAILLCLPPLASASSHIVKAKTTEEWRDALVTGFADIALMAQVSRQAGITHDQPRKPGPVAQNGGYT